MKTLLLACPLIALAIPAHAQFRGGNKLFEECKSKGADEMFCLGYIAGVADGYEFGHFFGVMAKAIGRPWELHLCLPDGVTIGQMQEIVIRYLKLHVERRQDGASNLTVDALQEAFRVSVLET